MRRDQVLTLLKSKIDALLPTNAVSAIATAGSPPMRRIIAPVSRVAALAILPASETRLGAQWRTFVKDLFDPYRPERHYMRGPGPKWREKHGIAAAA